jgi:hypothetical protein
MPESVLSAVVIIRLREMFWLLTLGKRINALIKKYPDSCSICHEVYDEDDVTYTVFGYDRKVKYRSPRDAVPNAEMVLLGVCGCLTRKNDEIMQNHPGKAVFHRVIPYLLSLKPALRLFHICVK